MEGRSVGKIIIIILSFRVGTFRNKSIDHQVKETFAVISTQVTCETEHISLLTIPRCQVHSFVFYVFHCNLKE